MSRSLFCLTLLACGLTTAGAIADERTENFDRDPHWDGYNNRARTPEPQLVSQLFAYSKTNHAGGATAGEIGGSLTPAAEPTYYAKPLKTLDYQNKLTASGKLNCTGRQFHLLVGFFNASTVNEWRTPNSIVLRLYGRGEVFYAYVEYATSRWRAGGDSPGGFATVVESDTGKSQLKGFASGTVHTWSLAYDPDGDGGNGTVIAKIDDQTAVCNLTPGHTQDGATFNRFGILNIPKHLDQGGETWFDDIVVNGEREAFDADPRWEAVRTPATYRTTSVRPRFDFGYSPTHFAGGLAAGELGGEIFRGDCRYPERLAYYGDRVQELTLERPIRAAGRVAMRRGISDSTTLVGFFNSKTSVAVSETPSTGFPVDFLGLAIEGPSREGFYFYPVYHFADGTLNYGREPDLPRIFPDGKSAQWSLEYAPPQLNSPGRLTATLAGQHGTIEVEKLPATPSRFDRFGIVATWIDGNSQHVYFDDLRYVVRQ